jgi:mannose/fructose/N-acetylgalactosamine-specific phosphotransferase system component IIB
VLWVRIDNRLVHGQIIEAWLPYTNARTLVVGNDELAQDDLRQQIMSIAIPLGIEIVFLAVAAVGDYLTAKKLLDKNVLVLFADCRDACRGYETGLHFATLNLGNLHYGPGKKQLCQHIALSSEDETCLNALQAKGVVIDYRCIPSDPAQIG